jgi:hypothetical protein
MKNVDSRGTIMDSARVAGAIRPWSFVILFGLVLLISATSTFAQSSSNRWLLVYNTSASMRDRVRGMEAVTQDLLTTAMHGTIRGGDTIGIWTYSTQLHAEEAPLQTWHPETAGDIAQHTLDFLSRHAYQKTAAFNDVLTNMLRVIKSSEVITVILISDGSDAIQGTPFDARVAAFYKANYQEQKKARMPFVTVFRGEKGIITTNTLGLAPWPVEIPVVPVPAPMGAKAPAPTPAVAPAKPVPSLIVIGKKAETTYNVPADLPDHSGQLATAAPAPVVPKTETPAPAPAVEEKSKPAAAPVISAPTMTPPAVAATTSAPAAAVEPPKTVQPVEPQVVAIPESNEPPAKVAAAPGAETATVVPERNLFTARNIAIVSVTFTLLVCALLFLSARNARRATRASLITRSLDRDKR